MNDFYSESAANHKLDIQSYNHVIKASKIDGYKERDPILLSGEIHTTYAYIILPFAKYGSLLEVYINAISKG